METGQKGPSINPEQLPPAQTGVEAGPAAPNAEQLPGISPEEVSTQHEHSVAPPSDLPQQVNDITTVSPVRVADDSAKADDTTELLSALPSTASDDDQIEKEWVDKAKQVLRETADDPYRRDAAISSLRREYKAKRYGGDAGSTSLPVN